MAWQADADLTALTTFGVPARAQWLCTIDQEDQLPVALQQADSKDLPVTVLGGGSNMLLLDHVPGLVLHMQLKGIRHHADPDNQDAVLVTVAAGENWHQLVETCLHKGWHGLENLALIPGSVGAAPVQNIGAYGVELADVLVSLRYFDTQSVQVCTLDRDGCQFAYRDSIFKQSLRNQAVILSVTLRLSREPQTVVTYPALLQHLSQRSGVSTAISPWQVFEAVCDIRRSKLPDPAVIGNAGSFFRNPIISADAYVDLQSQWPDIPAFATATTDVKVPAAWLIDRAGWKGVRHGAVGVHDKQALVLVNHGGGTGQQILALAREIMASVEQIFGVRLQPEVCVLPASAGDL
ncbi:MAG: UDP-N-acetylenolpyruvoylglucosamine reductase [Gammaproteobacteria bacterium]|nr:UDP-N-acetylenolpyruvoylglucosamine reductase [Gammaproteobacteria bacterium]|tara:strand:- start:170 stop:1219 length:1050 start_codon:yes stop_codon:yes gene_type:complete